MGQLCLSNTALVGSSATLLEALDDAEKHDVKQ